MSDSTEALLLQNLGEDFLAYVTATTPAEIHARLTSADGHMLTDRQERVLGDVAATLIGIASIGEQPELLQLRLTEVFGHFDEAQGTTLANVLRLNAGGTLEELTSSDSLEKVLLAQLRDVYPLFLLPVGATPFSPPTRSLGAVLIRHPEHANLERAVLDSPVVSQLFPDASKHLGQSGYAITSAGRVGTAQVSLFANGIIEAGWDYAHLSHARPTVEDHAAGLKTALTIVIAATQNKPATIPVRIGLTGVLLPDDVDLDLGWARIRAADNRDANPVIDSTVPGSIQTSDESGQNVAVKYRGDLVMEMEIPYRISLKRPDVEHGVLQSFSPSGIIEPRVENARLGLLLSAEVEPRALILQSWLRVFDPLHGGGALSWRDPQSMRNIYPRKLTVDDAAAWKKWAILIGNTRQKSVDVAIRRALLAASERNSPEDMLVDAVVVWENLFGARQETTMRVTASLAWLLADSVEDRTIKQAQYKNIYELRSGVVHGSHALTKREDLGKPNEALDIALQALRAIFGDRPDLIAEKDSAARGNRLLLGG